MNPEGKVFELGREGIPKATCPVCGSILAHPGGIGGCPQVKEIEFNADGSIKKVVKR